MTILLYKLLFVAVVLDAVASSFTAAYIFRLRQRFGWYVGFAFTGIAVEATVALITMGLSPAPQRIVAWWVTLRIFTRLFKTVAMVMLPLYMLGYLNGGKHDAK